MFLKIFFYFIFIFFVWIGYIVGLHSGWVREIVFVISLGILTLFIDWLVWRTRPYIDTILALLVIIGAIIGVLLGEAVSGFYYDQPSYLVSAIQWIIRISTLQIE